MKRLVTQIQGEHVSLRLLEAEDLSLTLGWRNQDHIRRWFVYSDLISPEGHLEWFHKYLERDNDFVFIIVLHQHLQKPIGQIALYDIDWEAQTAEFGRIMIGETDATGRGFASEATRLLLDHAFQQWSMTRIDLEVLEHNALAISLYERCGFKRTGQIGNLIQMSASRSVV